MRRRVDPRSATRRCPSAAFCLGTFLWAGCGAPAGRAGDTNSPPAGGEFEARFRTARALLLDAIEDGGTPAAHVLKAFRELSSERPEDARVVAYLGASGSSTLEPRCSRGRRGPPPSRASSSSIAPSRSRRRASRSARAGSLVPSPAVLLRQGRGGDPGHPARGRPGRGRRARGPDRAIPRGRGPPREGRPARAARRSRGSRRVVGGRGRDGPGLSLRQGRRDALVRAAEVDS